MLDTLDRHFEDKGYINLEECFNDGTFVIAKKSSKKGKIGRGKGLSQWDASEDLMGIVPVTALKRIITSWDWCCKRFTEFVHLAFSMILLRRIRYHHQRRWFNRFVIIKLTTNHRINSNKISII